MTGQHLQLVHAAPAGPPTYTEHRGQPVTWTAWELDRNSIVHVCDGCEMAGDPWVGYGTVHQPLVETASSMEPVYPLRRISAAPRRRAFHHRLLAYRCRSCDAIHIYDSGSDGRTFTEVGYSPPSV